MKNFDDFVRANKAVIYAAAEANTKRNANGDAGISRDDPWFYEDDRDDESPVRDEAQNFSTRN